MHCSFTIREIQSNYYYYSLQGVHEGVVCCLGLVVAVEEERVVIGPPAISVRDSPDGDSDTLGDLETSVHDGEVVVGSSTGDIELGDGNFRNIGCGKGSESSGNTRGRVPSARSGQVALGSNTIDGNALGEPPVDVGNHTGSDLGVVGNVQVVVIDIELGVGIGGACCAEGNANEVLAENTAENTVAEIAVLCKDLIDNIPVKDSAPIAGNHGSDMVLDHLSQGVAVVNARHPSR